MRDPKPWLVAGFLVAMLGIVPIFATTTRVMIVLLTLLIAHRNAR